MIAVERTRELQHSMDRPSVPMLTTIAFDAPNPTHD